MTRRMVCDCAAICDTALSTEASGWKNTFTTVMPASDCDSMCSMPVRVVVSDRSNWVANRRSISSGGRPLYDQITETTGTSSSGRMSVGMRSAESTPNSTTNSAPTMKVYGRRRASETIHMGQETGARERRATSIARHNR